MKEQEYRWHCTSVNEDIEVNYNLVFIGSTINHNRYMKAIVGGARMARWLSMLNDRA